MTEATESPKGLICANMECQSTSLRVDYTRRKNNSIERRRVCNACGFTMVTKEVAKFSRVTPTLPGEVPGEAE